MVESDDWVLPYSSQAAIMELALLMEKHREFAADRDLLKKERDETEDAMTELDLKGSWVSVGESYILINSENEDEVTDALERKHGDLEAKVESLESLLTENEKDAERVKKIIHAALGDKVHLNL